MKNVRVHIAVIVAALAAVLALASFAALSSRGQSPTEKSKSLVKPTVLITNHTRSVGENASASFAGAAARNAFLKNELNWTFGGKQQHGWYLYDLLIGQTLQTKNDSVKRDFAAELAVWQEKMGLNPGGVLDEDSLMTMVSQWQSNRLKNRTYAEP